jgi:zinc finger protein
MTELPSSDDWHEGNEEDLTTIEGCYCPNCGGGRARTLMLPTKVPCFREIIIMALNCEDCAFRNSEVNFGGEIQPKGERMTLVVNSTDDLNRQLIKSDSASLFVPKLDFEIPRTTQRGSVSTIEGVLKTAAESLETLQPERLRLGDIDNFHRCRKVINQLKRYAGDEALDDDDDDEEEKASIFPYEIILDDPAGNSFIENPFAPSPDPNMKSDKYWRNPSQDMSLGLQPSQKAVEEGSIDNANPLHKNVANASAGSHRIEKLSSTRDGTSIGREEVMKFPTTCSHCYKPAETDMCITDIPHFKEVIIMSMVCDNCGYKSNEIKGGTFSFLNSLLLQVGTLSLC